MLTGVVCYIERTPGGSGIRRIRLVGPELDRAWVAPGLDAADGQGRSSAPGAQIAAIRSAAAWIAEELAPVREIAALCVDGEGGVCAWISAPSADERVVVAAVRQGATASTSPADAAGRPAGFGLLPEDASGFGSVRSIQALAAPEPHTPTSLASMGKKVPVMGPRKRLGVLSVADAPVRVLLDELDRLRIGVGAVLSLWHAAALAWDPSASAIRRPTHNDPVQNGTTNGHAPIVVEAESPVTAVVIVDPAGRLTWAWSKNAELLAAGAMRLRTHTFTSGAAESIPDLAGDENLAPVARRLASEEPPHTVHAAECAPGDLGRLVMDWLSWSMQLGQTPERVVCIGPATIPGRPGSAEPAPTPQSLAQGLAAAWSGATIDAAVHDDPIGATLNRLRALPMFAPAKSGHGEISVADDPRRNMVSLSSRPGRLDRAMHHWAALAILVAAVAVFLYARRLGSGIEELRSGAGAAQSRRLELLQGVENLVPGVTKGVDPIGLLSSKTQDLSMQLSKLAASKPLLQPLVKVLEIFKQPGFESIEISSISASDFRISVEFTVPVLQDSVPAQVRTRLDEIFGPGVWEGSWGTTSGDRRPYTISSTTLGGAR